MTKSVEVSEDDLVQQAARDKVDRLVVGAVVARQVNNELAILVLRRASNDFMGGIEELPSGKVEDSEGLLAALGREVAEETGLVIQKVLGYMFSFDYTSASGRYTRQFNFVARADDSDVQLDAAEHDSFRWLPYDQVYASSLTDNIKSALHESWDDLCRKFAVD